MNIGDLPTLTTPKQKKALELILKRIKNGKFKSFKRCMKDAGFSDTTAHNPKQNLLDRKGFKKLLNKDKYDLEPVMDNIYGIAKDREDKRSAIRASKLIFNAMDLMPDKNSDTKVSIYQEQGRVFE